MAYRHRDRYNHRNLGKCFGNGLDAAQTNGRNLVAATAMGPVDSPEVELFAVASLSGNIAFLAGCVFCVCRWACAPVRGGHFSRNVHGPKHSTHEAYNRTAKEAKNAKLIANARIGANALSVDNPSDDHQYRLRALN